MTLRSALDSLTPPTLKAGSGNTTLAAHSPSQDHTHAHTHTVTLHVHVHVHRHSASLFLVCCESHPRLEQINRETHSTTVEEAAAFLRAKITGHKIQLQE